MNDKSIDSIWKDVNLAFNGANENVKSDRLTIKSEYDRLSYNILASGDKLKLIDCEMRRQCSFIIDDNYIQIGFYNN